MPKLWPKSGGMTGKVVAMVDQKSKAIVDATDQLGLHHELARQILSQLWDSAFELGRIAALDELQDRFCVCMK
jgi:hypothetical protein